MTQMARHIADQGQPAETFTFDRANRLTATSGGAARYVYDGLGRRVSESDQSRAPGDLRALRVNSELARCPASFVCDFFGECRNRNRIRRHRRVDDHHQLPETSEFRPATMGAMGKLGKTRRAVST